jgi:hypothetical protein
MDQKSYESLNFENSCVIMDVNSNSQSEYERDQILDEPNHDPCEDYEEFEFDKTGARIGKSQRDPYKKFVEGVDVCVSDDCVCSPPSSSSSPSPPSPSPSSSSPSSSSSIPPNLPVVSPSKKTSSSSSSSSSSIILKFSNVFSCCQVGPPEEDIELIRHLSQKWLNPPLVIGDDFKVVPKTSLVSETQVISEILETQVIPENKLVRDEVVMDEIPAFPSVKKHKSRKMKRDNIEVQEAKVFKRSVTCDDDEDSGEMRKSNLKRKRVIENNKPKRESIDFGPVLPSLSKAEKFSLLKFQQRVSSLILK